MAKKIKVDKKDDTKKGTVQRSNPRLSRRLKRESGKEIMVEKKKQKRERQEQNRKLREELGDAAPVPKTRTIENTREYDVTTVDPTDAEVGQLPLFYYACIPGRAR
jgi:hypothetical protein